MDIKPKIKLSTKQTLAPEGTVKWWFLTNNFLPKHLTLKK